MLDLSRANVPQVTDSVISKSITEYDVSQVYTAYQNNDAKIPLPL